MTGVSRLECHERFLPSRFETRVVEAALLASVPVRTVR
jgi:hypothetical protein